MKDVEPLLERGQREKVKVDEKRLQQLVRGFATDWKKSIEILNQDIMQSFTNFKNGTAILQVEDEEGGEGERGREGGRERGRKREGG